MTDRKPTGSATASPPPLAGVGQGGGAPLIASSPTLPRARAREQAETAGGGGTIPAEHALARYRTPLLGVLAVVLFFAAWQALFLVVPFNPLFISKPSLILASLLDLIRSGELLDELRVSAVPFAYGLAAAVVVGVAIGMVMGWRARVGYALDPLMTALYASPLVALAPLIMVFFGVGVAAKSIIIFSLAVFPFIFNAYAGVRAVDPLLINVVRSLGGSEPQLYAKVILPSILPYIVAAARLGIGRALVGVLVGEFFAASEGIGYAIARFGDLYALDKMFACILTIMVIAVILTEAVRWAERAAFPWRVGA